MLSAKLAPLALVAVLSASLLEARVATSAGFARGDDSRASVIVEFALPAAPARADAAGRAAISVHQDQLLLDLASEDLAVAHRYATLPAMAVRVSPQAASRLAAHPLVRRISPDRAVHAELTETAAIIEAVEPRDVYGVTGTGVTVAVIDTGIDTDHPDLVGGIAFERCFSTAATCPGAATTGSGPGSAEDGNGHGTHVSGIISSDGVVAPKGIAPDAQIAAYRSLEASGSGTSSDVIAALDDILANHPEVRAVNMSLSDGVEYAGACDSAEPLATTAINGLHVAGTLTFAASGNNGHIAGTSWPSCITNVVSTGAVWDATLPFISFAGCTQMPAPVDTVTCFTNSGVELDLLAPGASVTSTALGGGTEARGGTSMAAPAAAAVAAMLWQIDPSLTPAAIETVLETTGDPKLDARNGLTRPRVNAKAAVTSITDADGDGVSSYVDNCPADSNVGQENTDAAALDNGPLAPGTDATILMSDSAGDACDTDDDNDGVLDLDEVVHPVAGCATASAVLDPLDIDTDGDHLTDGWECANGSDPANAASKALGSGGSTDADGDRIPDDWEMRGYNASGASTDSDGDGCHDLVEIASIDGNKTVTIADSLAVARGSLGIWPPEPNQDYLLDIDKNGTVGISDRLFVARAALLSTWQPKTCA